VQIIAILQTVSTLLQINAIIKEILVTTNQAIKTLPQDRIIGAN